MAVYENSIAFLFSFITIKLFHKFFHTSRSSWSAATTRGPGVPGPPKSLSLKKIFSKVFSLLFHRLNTSTFCKEDVKEACFSHSLEWKIKNFLAHWPQPWWGLLSYNTILECPSPQYQKRGYDTAMVIANVRQLHWKQLTYATILKNIEKSIFKEISLKLIIMFVKSLIIMLIMICL